MSKDFSLHSIDPKSDGMRNKEYSLHSVDLNSEEMREMTEEIALLNHSSKNNRCIAITALIISIISFGLSLYRHFR
jgi:hypothetical protein